jgi:hypothetical protein
VDVFDADASSATPPLALVQTRQHCVEFCLTHGLALA